MAADTPQDQTSQPDPKEGCRFPKEVTLKYDHEPLNNLHQSINRQASALESANVDATRIPEGQLQEQRSSNNIAIRAMWVNGVLTLITAGVFACTVISLWYTRKDVDAAQAQFEISNRPFIGLSDFKVDSINIGQHLNIICGVYNSGKFPARIDSFMYIKGTAGATNTKEAIVSFIKNASVKNGSLSNFILPSLPITAPFLCTDGSPLSKTQFDSLKNGSELLLLRIEIKYTNFLTGARYYKKEIYEIQANPIETKLLDATEGTF
jgi:hypothetical protein